MDVTLPSLGEGADSGIVVSLLVNEGDTVEKGQTILELENEKKLKLESSRMTWINDGIFCLRTIIYICIVVGLAHVSSLVSSRLIVTELGI